MYLCYLDESGTPDHTSNTSHFVLLGIAFPVHCWRTVSTNIHTIKHRYGLSRAEIHTGWLARQYQAQESIPGFSALGWADRKQQTEREWQNILRTTQVTMTAKAARNEKKRYSNSSAYFHLTFDDRLNLLREISDTLNNMSFIRIFAESIDKVSCPTKSKEQIIEQAFMQVVTRFEYYLEVMSQKIGNQQYGILVQDNNDTVNDRLKSIWSIFMSLEPCTETLST